MNTDPDKNGDQAEDSEVVQLRKDLVFVRERMAAQASSIAGYQMQLSAAQRERDVARAKLGEFLTAAGLCLDAKCTGLCGYSGDGCSPLKAWLADLRAGVAG